MKGLSIITLTAGLLSATSEAIQLVQREAAPAVLGLAIERNAVSDPFARDGLRRRQNTKTVMETLDNEVSAREAGYGYQGVAQTNGAV